MLPAGYELEGRRLLDFGCGAGRTLRHFLDQADSAEIWGSDIDAESIDWLQRNLCPPLHCAAQRGRAGPAVRRRATSTSSGRSRCSPTWWTRWAPWLLELHRVLADDGILIATTIGPSHSERFAKERWDEDRIGMNALRRGPAYPHGAPVVLHSTWWLRAHWGRAFEILEMSESAPKWAPAHRWLAMRKRDVTLTVADLERPEPGEPRELTAVRHNVQQLRRELDEAHEQPPGQAGPSAARAGPAAARPDAAATRAGGRASRRSS